MQPLQAIVASNQLKKLDKVIKIRNSNAKYFDKMLLSLSEFITLPERPKKYLETFALYMIIAKKRDKLLIYLNKNSIEAKIHYPIPLHLQKASKIFGYGKPVFPVAEFQAKHLISIPIHQFINSDHIDYMVKHLKNFYLKK